jgi:hypothetical protein
VSPQEFDALVRRELAARDNRRRLRLFDAAAYEEADRLFVNAVAEAAGFGPSGDAEKTVRRSRRAARASEDRAFGEAS